MSAYAQGLFPMARGRRGRIDWYSPDPRAVLPLSPPEAFRVSHSLARVVRRGVYTVTFDRAFAQVIRACAEPRPGHGETWINDAIIRAYCQLHQLGLAHSVEAWLPPETPAAPATSAPTVTAAAPTVAAPAASTAAALTVTAAAAPTATVPTPAASAVTAAATPAASDPAATSPGVLAGGLYGVSLGGAFFGESMFSRATDASKVCLVHLVSHLRNRGYALLDTQISNAHMAQFGVVEIPREQYLRQLQAALAQEVTW